MRTILVPTDFSTNAFVAAQYAASLAKEADYKVVFYHVYIVLYAGFEEKGVSVTHMEWADQEASKAMENLLKTMRAQYPDVEIDGACERGFLIDALAEKLKKENSIGLIVMGTKGVTNVTESIFGSTTYEVLKKVTTPVLVIPGNTPDFSLAHVGFFSDYNEHELDAMDRMIELLPSVRTFDIIHFIKPGTPGKIANKEEWKSLVKGAFPDRKIAFEDVEVQKVDINSVGSIAAGQALDLMVFTRPQKPFFEKIFGRSLTKAVANYPVIPSLFIKE